MISNDSNSRQAETTLPQKSLLKKNEVTRNSVAYCK